MTMALPHNDEAFEWTNAIGLTVADCEKRLLTACKTLRALPDRERRFQMVRNSWPEMLLKIEEAYGFTEAVMPKFRPTPADVSDCLVALAWAQSVPRKIWKFIWWRSFGMSFGQMADKIGRSDERARQIYRDAILTIWSNAKPEAINARIPR